MTATWPGTEAELHELLAAYKSYCRACCSEPAGRTCAAHQAELEDQAWLGRIVFERRRRAELLEQEGVGRP